MDIVIAGVVAKGLGVIFGIFIAGFILGIVLTLGLVFRLRGRR